VRAELFHNRDQHSCSRITPSASFALPLGEYSEPSYLDAVAVIPCFYEQGKVRVGEALTDEMICDNLNGKVAKMTGERPK
jgi:hypothetical protein